MLGTRRMCCLNVNSIVLAYTHNLVHNTYFITYNIDELQNNSSKCHQILSPLLHDVVGVAGCCAKTTIAPLDRVKILLQAHNPHYKHLGKSATLERPDKCLQHSNIVPYCYTALVILQSQALIKSWHILFDN